MSSDILKPDPSSTDSPWGQAVPNSPESDNPSSADELSLDLFVIGTPDPMLQPLDSSADDLGRKIADVQPDPMLASLVGEVVEPATRDAQAEIDDAIQREQREPEAAITEFDSIRTDARLTSPAQRNARENEDQQVSNDEDEDEVPSRGSSLLVILLASYASAVTLGLVWVLFSGRKLHDSGRMPKESPTIEVNGPLDPGERADRSRIVGQLKLIPDSNRTSLGSTVRLADLEVTPLQLTEGPVELERTLTERKTRKGGEHALKLEVRFRNASQSAIFAPLDEGFIRQRLRADPESFVESASGESIISMFPLAVDSEWSITGQEFRELRPNESFESLIVSEPNAMSKILPEMVWRIRLRTGINQISDLGLMFRPADITTGK